MRGRISFSSQNSIKSFTFTLVYTTYVPEYNSPSVLSLSVFAAFFVANPDFCYGIFVPSA